MSTQNSTVVFRNVYINSHIQSFLSVKDQEDISKRVDRTFRAGAEKAQRLKIMKTLSPESIAAFGRENLEKAPICNFPKDTYVSQLSSSDLRPGSRSKRNVFINELPASFVIGFRGENRFYAAVRVKTVITGRACLSRYSLEVDRFGSVYYVGEAHGPLYQGHSAKWDDIPDMVRSQRPMLSGGEIEVQRSDERYPDEPEKPRCSQRLFFCLRRALFRCGFRCGLLKTKQKLA